MRTNKRWNKDVTVRAKAARWMFRVAFAAALLVCGGLIWTPAMAQTGGDGAIQGTVKDSTGAIIPSATVTAKNVGTGVETTRTSSSDGLYNVGPLIPGVYEVTVTANGFATFKQ